MNISERMAVYGRLMRVEKPIGTYLVAWPMLWALWMAGSGHPDASIVFIFLAGAFLMRSAGCVINDFADRDIDAHVARTRSRPLATGEASPREALALFGGLALAAFLLVMLLNTLTLQLAFVGIGLAILYPFMKRITHLPQFFLGAAFSWAIPMAFAAVLGEVPLIAWVMLLANVSWVVAYDTMYAMVDRDDDLRIGVKSTAILFGRHDRLIVGILQFNMLLLLTVIGSIAGLGIVYYCGLLAAAATFAYQQVLIRERERESCFTAFLNNHYSGALVFIGLFLDYALKS